MGLLDRFRSGRTSGGATTRSGTEAYLRDWAAARRGVEAFVEPPTVVTETTVVFVAHDGEWTRRRITPKRATKLARALAMPIYDVQRVGYPQRMRDHDSRERLLRKREEREELLRKLRDKDRER
ncbi:oxidoreductase [Pseudonocardia phyllosphaerae]|uniref:oxidoreductase n=1 Tax=Pseudonocardia phyllosphaerae TaxID=3390502 RepID=UPI00397C97B9